MLWWEQFTVLFTSVQAVWFHNLLSFPNLIHSFFKLFWEPLNLCHFLQCHVHCEISATQWCSVFIVFFNISADIWNLNFECFKIASSLLLMTQLLIKLELRITFTHLRIIRLLLSTLITKSAFLRFTFYTFEVCLTS